ncbi:DUF4381 domain-containing protein [Alteromonas flava]|uniref:DUF4381 domain-containing protein n=1 Tax=Alteromonas flava TaxID=2048003 RepID=UPI0013DC20F0|nr:DUF4381 domain-containing protein [Alteromonas flava]
MDPLAQLNDIALTEPAGWWPLAWGWWLLIGLTIGAVVGIIVFALYRYRKYRVLRLARQRVQQLDMTQTPWQGAQQINALLKQTLMHYFPHLQPQQLHGQHWYDLLNATLPKRHRAVFAAMGKHSFAVHYLPPQQVEAQTALDYQSAALHWLTKTRLTFTAEASHV